MLRGDRPLDVAVDDGFVRRQPRSHRAARPDLARRARRLRPRASMMVERSGALPSVLVTSPSTRPPGQ